MPITKPPVLPVWGESNTTSADMVQPTNPQIQAGWPNSVTPPSRQRFNWLFNLCTNAIRYFSRRGIVDYDAAETYSQHDLVRGDDNKLTRSLANTNTANTPSTTPAKWGAPLTYLLPVDDNTDGAASTAWFMNQLSLSTPLMDGIATFGVSKRATRADHVHPSDTSKANTSGTYPNLNVGFATSAGTAARARPVRGDGVSFDLYWSGQSGQPTWLMGSNDGVNWYVYNPSNFSVNYATLAGSAGYATNAGSANTATNAGYATNAGSANAATNAGYATNAGHSTNSDHATNADNASYSATQPAGTSNTAIATTAFACPGYSHGPNGYDVCPSGRIEQWFYVWLGDTSGQNFWNLTYPIPFPSECFNVLVTLADNNFTNNASATVTVLRDTTDQNGFTVCTGEFIAITQALALYVRATGK